VVGHDSKVYGRAVLTLPEEFNEDGRVSSRIVLYPVFGTETQTYTRSSPSFEFVIDLGILVMAPIATRSTDLAANLLDNTRHHVAYFKWYNTRFLKPQGYLEFIAPLCIGGSKSEQFPSPLRRK
jgi:hypothetical protein